MGTINSIQKDPVGTVENLSTANDISELSQHLGEAGVALAAENKTQAAKSLIDSMLDLLGMAPMYGGVPFMPGPLDGVRDKLSETVDKLDERRRRLEEAFDHLPSNPTPHPAGGGSGGVGGGTSSGMGGGAASAGAQAAVPARYDPLALDLDGDGIETISAQSANPVLFDFDADGIKTGTGWVGPDDGWLVLDRDGNGTIDRGGGNVWCRHDSC